MISHVIDRLQEAPFRRRDLWQAVDQSQRRGRQRHIARQRRDEASAFAPDLLQWGRALLPEHFRDAPSAMHVWLADELAAWRERRGQRLNVIGPRGAAKSTLGTLAYPLRCALEGHEPYIWIVSDTRPQAWLHLANIKTELLENELLREAYPDAAGRGPLWCSGAIVLRNGGRSRPSARCSACAAAGAGSIGPRSSSATTCRTISMCNRPGFASRRGTGFTARW
jgi:hypothetical protein